MWVCIYAHCTYASGVRPNAEYPKAPLCDSSDVLVRRFFLFDVVSAITSINSDNTAATPTTIRYASFISIEASQVINTPSRIYPPVLTITYTDVSTSTITVRSVVDVQLSTAYTSDPSAFRTTFYSLFITIMVEANMIHRSIHLSIYSSIYLSIHPSMSKGVHRTGVRSTVPQLEGPQRPRGVNGHDHH